MPVCDAQIDAEIKARFDLDGFINFGRILPPEDVEILSKRFDDIADGTLPMPDGVVRFHKDVKWGPGTNVTRRDAVFQILGAHKHDDVIRHYCELPLIKNLLETLLDAPAVLNTTQVVIKPAYHGGTVPWHQDTSYWGQEKRMTCWLALDDATPFNGCMRMIPGSHRRGQIKFTPKLSDEYGINLLETDGVNEDTQVYVPVRAGCASIHHPLTLHASDKNPSPHRRRGLAITYLAQ